MGSYSRPRIDAYAEDRDEQRALDSTERRARSRAAILANGGRSAPQANPPSGLTTGGLGTGESSLRPESSWREMFARNPAAESAASAAVAGSPVRRNINTLNAYSDGAIAASPAPYRPTSAPLRGLPNMKLSSSDASGDVAALARNVAMTRPGGLSRYDSISRPAPRRMLNPYDAGSEISNASGIAQGLEPVGQTWQQQIAEAHPEIHQAGTPENLMFVEAAKAARANGEPINAGTMDALAQRVKQSLAAQKAAETMPTAAPISNDTRRLSVYA